MDSRQRTFSLIPDHNPVPITTDAPDSGRILTSKQLEKVYRQTKRTKRLSRVEQREHDRREQARIRRELDEQQKKDAEANKRRRKAQVAKDRQLARDEVAKAEKRKLGKPLVDVHASQDTLTRFFGGKKLQPNVLAAVEEEEEEDSETVQAGERIGGNAETAIALMDQDRGQSLGNVSNVLGDVEAEIEHQRSQLPRQPQSRSHQSSQRQSQCLSPGRLQHLSQQTSQRPVPSQRQVLLKRPAASPCRLQSQVQVHQDQSQQLPGLSQRLAPLDMDLTDENLLMGFEDDEHNAPGLPFAQTPSPAAFHQSVDDDDGFDFDDVGLAALADVVEPIPDDIFAD